MPVCSYKFAAGGDRCRRPYGSSEVHMGRDGDYMNRIDRSLDKHGSKICHYFCLRSAGRAADRSCSSNVYAPAAALRGVYYAGSGRKAPQSRTHPESTNYGYGFAGGKDTRHPWAQKGSKHGDNVAGLASTLGRLTLMHEKNRGKLLVGTAKLIKDRL